MLYLMEEIVAIRLQRFFEAGIFLGAIAFGMHVTGQTTPPMPNTALGDQANAPPVEVAPGPPATTGPATTTGLPAGQGAPDLQTMQKMFNGANGAGAAVKQPAYGQPALKIADDLGNINSGTDIPGKEDKPVKFVPSVVETYSPKKLIQSDPRAVLHTSMGDIKIRLFSAYAPKTVHNFIDLARGDREFLDSRTGKPTRRPFYTDLTFHRVIQGFLVQTGCPFGTGHGGPGFNLSDEINPALRFSRPGMVAMAPERKDPVSEKKDSNGSQFFISLAPMPAWDDKFTIFGEVEKGMSVLEKIGRAQTGPTDRPIKRVYLNSIEIFEDATPKDSLQAPENTEPQ